MENKSKRIEHAFASNPDYYLVMKDWHAKHGGKAIEPEMFDLVTSVKKGKVLDAGCGEGSIIKWLAQHCPELSCFAIDISPIGVAMGRASDKSKRIQFNCADLKQIPFKSEQFDLIYAQSVLEHIFDYRQALAEFSRILRPGGLLALRTSNGSREGGYNILMIIIRYIFRLNRVRECQPSLMLGEDILYDHMHNFDACHIPSDILLYDLRKLGLRIEFFTTCRHLFLQKRKNWIDGTLRNIVAHAPVFPFNHLGPTIIVGAKKQVT